MRTSRHPSDQTTVDEEMQRDLPPPPTAEEIEQVRAAYEQTAERLDTDDAVAEPGR